MDEQEDAEASYRRGYQHGATAALDAVERAKTGGLQKLKAWAVLSLFEWRNCDAPQDRAASPPEPPI
jgi:hypothetical protein